MCHTKKNLAKKHGALWDVNKKMWYFTDTLDNKNKSILLNNFAY